MTRSGRRSGTKPRRRPPARMVPSGGIPANGTDVAITTTVPKEHRLRLTPADLILLVKLIDRVLPIPHDATERWYRAYRQREKFRELRVLREKLSRPSDRGRRTSSWRF